LSPLPAAASASSSVRTTVRAASADAETPPMFDTTGAARSAAVTARVSAAGTSLLAITSAICASLRSSCQSNCRQAAGDLASRISPPRARSASLARSVLTYATTAQR